MTPDAVAKRGRFFADLAERPLLMGIVNITPDSFSDGGRFLAPAAAIAEARRHAADGAAIIDVGAESTRPGHVPVDDAEERRRLAPVLAALVAGVALPVSIDTTKATVAAMAIEAGAVVVNDQWGLQRDPAMAGLVAATGAGVVLMHNRDAMDAAADVIDDMRRFFDRSLALAEDAGIPTDRMILDPGIGFGKSKTQNIKALGVGVEVLRAHYGLPVLVGVSRKSLFAALLGGRAVEDRLAGTLAANLAALARGARLFRVHDCAEHRDALAVTQAVADGRTYG